MQMQICHVRTCTGGHWSSTSSSPSNLKWNPLPGMQRNATSGHNLSTKQRCLVAVSPLCTFTACSLLETEKQGGGSNQPEDAETMQLKRGLTPRSGRGKKKNNSTLAKKAGQQTGREARCRGPLDLEMEAFLVKSSSCA